MPLGDFGNFQFISSWSNNYKSWKIQKDLPIIIVRYEDLLEKTFAVTKEIIIFPFLQLRILGL